MTLFRRLSRALAEHLGYFYPAELDNHCTAYIHALYLECDRARKFMVSESQRRMLERICTIR